MTCIYSDGGVDILVFNFWKYKNIVFLKLTTNKIKNCEIQIWIIHVENKNRKKCYSPAVNTSHSKLCGQTC